MSPVVMCSRLLVLVSSLPEEGYVIQITRRIFVNQNGALGRCLEAVGGVMLPQKTRRLVLTIMVRLILSSEERK